MRVSTTNWASDTNGGRTPSALTGARGAEHAFFLPYSIISTQTTHFSGGPPNPTQGLCAKSGCSILPLALQGSRSRQQAKIIWGSQTESHRWATLIS